MDRPRRFLLLMGAAALAAILFAPTAQGATTLRPRADGSVRMGGKLPRADHRHRLVVDGAPVTRSWVTFKLSAPATSGTLRLYVTGGRRSVPVTVRTVRESLVTAALQGRKAVAGRMLGRIASGRKGHWVSIDVSPALKRAGLVRFILATRSTRQRTFSSEEGRHAPRLVVRGASGSGGGTPPAGAGTSAKSAVTPPVLGPPTRFVATTGNDAGTCTAAAPCRTFDRAYHVAAPGEVVEIAGGDYGNQTFTTDAKNGVGCSSAINMAACVAFEPAAGSLVNVGNLTFGANYNSPGPGGIAIVATAARRLQANQTTLNRPRELATWGISTRNFYITGGDQMAIRGGDIGGVVDPEGTHPEIQRVYGTSPLIVPQNLTFEGVWFHDINTTSPTAHTDCLQIENGTNIVLRGNTFERCGSVGLRMSWGVETEEGPPTNVTIENNLFGPCADIPVSKCYYSAQPGHGINVLIRNNTFTQPFQPSGGPQYAQNVRFVGNVAPNVECNSYVSYSHNVWTGGKCGPTDKQVASLGLNGFKPAAGSPVLNAGDPTNFPAIDIDGTPRPAGPAPDAGAYEAG